MQETPKEDKIRVVSAWKMTVIAFFITSGGPFGGEVAVNAAGPAVSLFGFIILPLIFALPQALMTAELATMMDENGGYIIWSERAFGRFVGWLSALNRFLSNTIDMAVYPVLFVSYLVQLECGPIVNGTSVLTSSNSTLANLDGLETYPIKLGVVIIVLLMNIFGLEIVGWASAVLSVIIMIPFFIEWGFEFPHLEPRLWVDFKATHVNWNQFFSVVLWNYTGWDQLGAIAGEVKDTKKTYPRAVIAAIILNILVFLLPVTAGLAVDSETQYWEAGWFTLLACQVRDWLGIWIGVGAMISSVGQFNANLSSNARALWAMSTSGYWIPQFSYISRWHTPVISILFIGFTTCCLMPLAFTTLLSVDVFLNAVSLLFSFSALIWFKYKKPHDSRPFEVPFGNYGAWLVMIIEAMIVGFMMITSDASVFVIVIAANILFIIVYFIINNVSFKRKEGIIDPHYSAEVAHEHI
jgi:amino acid transporter